MNFSFLKNTSHRNLMEYFLSKHAEKICGNILDIGAGGRRYDHYFSGSITAVDIHPDEKKEIGYANLDETLPFENEVFDACICLEVFQYTKDIPHSIAEVSRVLKSGGQAILVIPHYYPEHGENWHVSKKCFTNLLKNSFSEVEVISYRNFWTVLADIFRLRVCQISFHPLKICGFILLAPFRLAIQFFVSPKISDGFYSGLFAIVKK